MLVCLSSKPVESSLVEFVVFSPPVESSFSDNIHYGGNSASQYCLACWQMSSWGFGGLFVSFRRKKAPQNQGALYSQVKH